MDDSPMSRLHLFLEQTKPMLSLLFFSCSFFSVCFLSIVLYRRLLMRRPKHGEDESKTTHNPFSFFKSSLSSTINKTLQNNKTHPLFLEILTSNPPKFDSLTQQFSSLVDNEQVGDGSELDKDGDDCRKSGKKKKKRGKKHKKVSNLDGGQDPSSIDPSTQHHKHQCLECCYPFTSSSSITQRKIKHQYDQLIKSHDSKALTMAQVGQFVNCLIEARNELQHKSEIIQRKFTITKALLLKVDRSSFDRISQQIYKLEAEQKRLEEDTSVYNRLQQQLKLSPAYKKMLEIGERMELKGTSDQLVDSTDNDFAGISFEELLAQEKRDTFWQKNGKLRSCTN